MPNKVWEHVVEVPSFETCSSRLLEALGRWGVTPTFEAGESLCRWSRQAWAAFYDLWLSQRNTLTDGSIAELREALNASVAALRGPEPEDLPAGEARLLRRFADSVEFRRDLLDLLRDEGVEAVDGAIVARSAARP